MQHTAHSGTLALAFGFALPLGSSVGLLAGCGVCELQAARRRAGTRRAHSLATGIGARGVKAAKVKLRYL